MKALQIGMHWFPERAGGLDRVYHSLAQSLPGAGVDVRGLIAGGEQASNDTAGKIHSFARADDSLLSRVWASRGALGDELRNHRPDIVAAHFALYVVGGLDLLKGFPLVMHFHGPWADESGVEKASGMNTVIKRRVEKAVYHRADKLIVLSRAFRDVLTNMYDVDPAKIAIVPGCVDVPHFDISKSRREARESLNLPLDRPIVFAVRRLVRRMGLEELIDAVALLKRRWPDVVLVIAGRGPLTAELQARAAAAGLTESVRLLGYVSDEMLPELYRAADISVVPTVALEGFGLITIESLSAGTPVLVTPVGGLPEVVTQLSENLILPNTGSEAIADRLGEFFAGTIKLPNAEECHAYALKNFDLPVIARKTADVYQQVIDVR
ncbi:glycosyltransferase family 4 protein [Robbsia sp. Bb-Pol-6]|uniref:Glycosyltransferase family 4 protein n=1 Tax=Robbsia betulipollinis TaxID=2981849 RepID=A0ABT3ZTA4_9BURK|nr:glycosyltransferase family 4 protein [Robbsia betulipollinis]MCY0389785.1 glycosyltransferase family 4 protein [Robbsia betulipollinis]